MSKLSSLFWEIANQLRGAHKPHQYGDVILAMTIPRRLDCQGSAVGIEGVLEE